MDAGLSDVTADTTSLLAVGASYSAYCDAQPELSSRTASRRAALDNGLPERRGSRTDRAGDASR